MDKRMRELANREWFTIEWSDTGDEWQTVYSTEIHADAITWWKFKPANSKLYRMVEHSTLRLHIPE